jgi:hypothetical protein
MVCLVAPSTTFLILCIKKVVLGTKENGREFLGKLAAVFLLD